MEINLSPADLAELYAVQANKLYGCNSFSDAQLAKMECVNYTLQAGDTLYLPKVRPVSLCKAFEKGVAYPCVSGYGTLCYNDICYLYAPDV
jgi:hypothetical protein